MVKKKKKLIPKVNPDRPFPPPPPKSKKRKNKTITRKVENKKTVVCKCGICNGPVQVTDVLLREFYFCAKCARGLFGKLGIWLSNFFVAFKSFLLGK